MARPHSNPRATPKKVVDGIVEDLAKGKPRQQGIIKQTAVDWGVSESVVVKLQKQKKQDIQMLREKCAENGFILSHLLDERILEAVQDDVKMAGTGLRDMAQAREKVIGSSVTALEGHQQAPVVNIAFVKQGIETLSRIDGVLAEKRAKARVVEIP